MKPCLALGAIKSVEKNEINADGNAGEKSGSGKPANRVINQFSSATGHRNDPLFKARRH